MDSKPTILINSESSLLPTGYGVITKNLCQGLHRSGFYNVVELASYLNIDDERISSLPWTVIGNMPPKNNPSQNEVNEYNSKPENQFNEFRFNDVCLEYQIDYCLTFRDYWYESYAQYSPFRKFFNYIYMPTIDAKPQATEWVQNMIDCDALLTYSHWAEKILKEQAKDKINFHGVAAAGVDLNIFKPSQNKTQQRSMFGLQDDILIIGSTMRNQKRKLFSDLIQAFSKFLKDGPEKLVQKTFLYLHTSYPDVGWHIPTLLKESGVGSKVLFTYLCQNQSCRFVQPRLFSDARCACPKCGNPTLSLPNCGIGVSNELLSEIYKLFDVYVQMANSEGLGIPIIEAAACGIHTMVVNYSAMEDFVWKLKATPIHVKGYSRESETHCYRAVPDQDDFIKKLIEFLSLPESIRANRGYQAYLGVKEWYTWERSVKVWMDAINSLPKKDHRTTWLSPPRIHQPVKQLPSAYIPTEEFVKWAIINIVGRPELLNTYFELRLSADLNMGIVGGSTGGLYYNELSTLGTKPNYKGFSREDAANELLNLCNYFNHWEKKRYQVLKNKGLVQ